MQDNGNLARDRDLGLLGPDALHEPGTPGLERRPALRAVQQYARGFEQVGPRQAVAPAGNPPREIELA